MPVVRQGNVLLSLWITHASAGKMGFRNSAICLTFFKSSFESGLKFKPRSKAIRNSDSSPGGIAAVIGWLRVKYSPNLASSCLVRVWYQHFGYCLRDVSPCGHFCRARDFSASIAVPLDFAAAITLGPISSWRQSCFLWGILYVSYVGASRWISAYVYY